MIALHKRVNGEVSPEAYDTYYQRNPLGEPLLGLCFHDHKLVGQENYIRQDVGCARALYKGALGINTRVDSDYRLFYGVFGKLIEMTIDTLKNELDILCAFANEESKKYYLKYFGWSVASKVRVYKKAVSYSGANLDSVLALARPGKLHNDVTLTKATQFDSSELEPLLDRYLDKSEHYYFHKTTQFINWKLLNNKRYDVIGYYILKNEELCGYCATCDNGTERRVVDLLIADDNTNIFNKTISTLAYFARKQGMKGLIIYATPNCWYEKYLRRQLFIRTWDFDFIVRNLSKRLPTTNWIIQIGDFDIF
jgi:hypothetical protein